MYVRICGTFDKNLRRPVGNSYWPITSRLKRTLWCLNTNHTLIINMIVVQLVNHHTYQNFLVIFISVWVDHECTGKTISGKFVITLPFIGNNHFNLNLPYSTIWYKTFWHLSDLFLIQDRSQHNIKHKHLEQWKHLYQANDVHPKFVSSPLDEL